MFIKEVKVNLGTKKDSLFYFSVRFFSNVTKTVKHLEIMGFLSNTIRYHMYVYLSQQSQDDVCIQ